MQLLRIRLFQIKRDLGYWAIAIAAAAFYLVKEISESKINYALGISAIFCIALYSYHTNRRDLNFIGKYFRNPLLQTCISYNIVALPLSVALLMDNFRYLSVLVHISASLTSFTGFRTRTLKLLFINRYVPARHFEWISGLRKNFPVLSVVFIAACILSPVKLFGPVALLMFDFILLGFYSVFEPLLMLNPKNLRPEEFLSDKIRFLTKSVCVINAPLLLVNSLFQPDAAWFNVGFILAFLLLAACTVHIKYSNYKPNAPAGFSIDLLVLTASVVFPYLIPLGILIYFSSKKKAINNLLQFST